MEDIESFWTRSYTSEKGVLFICFVIMEFMLLLYTFQVYLPFRPSDPQRQMSYYFSCYFQHLICNWYIVNPKENQPWIFIGRTDAEAEAPTLWPPNTKSQLIGRDPDAGKDWRQEGKGTTEDKMVGWHHQFNGHEFEQAPGVGDGQGSLACCSPWGCKELDTTEQLNNNNIEIIYSFITRI